MDLHFDATGSFLVDVRFWLQPRRVVIAPIEADPSKHWVFLEVAHHPSGCGACEAREEQVRRALRGTGVPYATTELAFGEKKGRFYRFALPAGGDPVEQLAALLNLEMRRSGIGPLIPLDDYL